MKKQVVLLLYAKLEGWKDRILAGILKCSKINYVSRFSGVSRWLCNSNKIIITIIEKKLFTVHK